MPYPRRIEGYAIVTEDGMLANASGIMPDQLKFEADQKFFERGLDRVDVVVHGRLCVPKTSSALINRRNRLTLADDVRPVLLHPGCHGLTIQVEEPT